jgi:hypothetical protein
VVGRSTSRAGPWRAALVAGSLVACGGAQELGTGTTLDVCSLVPPAEVEAAVGNQILLKPFVPSMEVRRADVGGVLIELFGDSGGLDRSPTPTRTDRVAIQGLCGYVFAVRPTTSGGPGAGVQSLVLGVYPVVGDPNAWLDATAGKLADQVLIRSGKVPGVRPRPDVGRAARLVTSGSSNILLAVDGATGVVAEGSAIDVTALETLTRAALAAATRTTVP